MRIPRHLKAGAKLRMPASRICTSSSSGARLQRLRHFVEGLTTITLNLLLAEKPLARELLQELVVKEAALEWIARIATVSTSAVREQMLDDIDNALDETRSDVNSPVNAAMEFRDELAYIT